MVQLLKIIFDQTSLTRCILCDFLFHLCSGTLELKASLIVFSFFEEKKGRGEECGGLVAIRSAYAFWLTRHCYTEVLKSN